MVVIVIDATARTPLSLLVAPPAPSVAPPAPSLSAAGSGKSNMQVYNDVCVVNAVTIVHSAVKRRMIANLPPDLIQGFMIDTVERV